MKKASAAAAKRGPKRAMGGSDDNDPTSDQPSEKIAKGMSKKSNDNDPVANLSSLKWNDLRDQLRVLGLPTCGKKAVLAERLSQYMKSISAKGFEKVSSNEEEEQSAPISPPPSPPPLPISALSPVDTNNVCSISDRSPDLRIDANPYSLDVNELQQKVNELEKKLQVATREANAAREIAENHLDCKPVIVMDGSERANELEKSLTELSTQFEEAKENLEDAEKRNKELMLKYANLVRENAELRKEKVVGEGEERRDSGSQDVPICDCEKKLANAKKREDKAYNNNRKLHQENSALTAEVANLKRTIDSRAIAERQMQETVDFLNRQLAELRAHNEVQARNGNGRVKCEVRSTIMQEDQKPPRMLHLQQNEELTREIAALNERLEEARKDAEAGKSKIDELTREISAIKEQLEEARKDADAGHSKIDELARENSALKEELTESKEIAKDEKNRVVALARDNSALKKELGESKETAKTEKNRVTELARENSAFKEELNEAREMAKTAKNRVVELTRDNSALKEELSLSKETAKTEKNRVAELTRANSALKQELNESREIAKVEKIRVGELTRMANDLRNIVPYSSTRPNLPYRLPAPVNIPFHPHPPAQAIVHLQEEVLLKWEEKFEMMYEEAVKRAQKAETPLGFDQIVEKKEDEFENKLPETSKAFEDAKNSAVELVALREELDELRRKVRDADNEKDELTRQNAAFKEQLVELRRATQDATSEKHSTEVLKGELADLKRTIGHGVTENQQLQARVNFLTYQLGNAHSQATRDRARIGCLTSQLAQHGGWQPPPPPMLQQQQQRAASSMQPPKNPPAGGWPRN